MKLIEGHYYINNLVLLIEGQKQTISYLKEVPDKAIQFQHIYLYLF